MAYKNRLLLFLLLFFTEASQSDGLSAISVYPVKIKGCPSTLMLKVPSEFTLANTLAAQESRSRLLAALNKPRPVQPYAKAKAHYSEILKTNWQIEWPPLPRIQIMSPGTVQEVQGKITPRNWSAIKKGAMNPNKMEGNRKWEQIRDYYRGKGVSIDAELFKPRAENKNTLVLKGITTLSMSDDTAKIITIAGNKTIYAKKCVAAVQVYVDLETPGAIEVLDGYLRKISIE